MNNGIQTLDNCSPEIPWTATDTSSCSIVGSLGFLLSKIDHYSFNKLKWLRSQKMMILHFSYFYKN